MTLACVGRRAEVSYDDEWGDQRRSTQIVAIGIPGSVTNDDFQELFNDCKTQQVQ